MERLIKDAYLDPKNPAAFSSISNVIRSTGVKNVKKIVKVLRSLPTYTVHHPVRHKFPRRKTFGHGPNYCLQADLCDYSAFKKDNDSNTFILMVIDVYSRFLYAEPILQKSGLCVRAAFDSILSRMPGLPVSILTDEGKEFYNKDVQELFKGQEI